jgi:hypothetical protein
VVWQPGRGQEKKLIGAVDHWWHGDGGANDELLADLAAFGADASCLPESLTKPQEFEVWPEHEKTILLFLRTQTQWRVSDGRAIGLDYGVVFQVMDLYAVKERRQALEDLQVMEARAKELINPKPAKGRRG